MTLPRLYALNDYWRKHPPAHIVAAVHAGYRPKPHAPHQDGAQETNVNDLAGMGFVVERKGPGGTADTSVEGLLADMSMEGFASMNIPMPPKE